MVKQNTMLILRSVNFFHVNQVVNLFVYKFSLEKDTAVKYNFIMTIRYANEYT